jgi:hypothetical protein
MPCLSRIFPVGRVGTSTGDQQGISRSVQEVGDPRCLRGDGRSRHASRVFLLGRLRGLGRTAGHCGADIVAEERLKDHPVVCTASDSELDKRLAIDGMCISPSRQVGQVKNSVLIDSLFSLSLLPQLGHVTETRPFSTSHLREGAALVPVNVLLCRLLCSLP